MLRAHRLGVDLEPLHDGPGLLQRTGHEAERLREHDPLDLPRPGGPLVVGDHGVHQRGGVLADHGDGGVDVAAADRVALLRHGAARSAAVRERLVDLADLGLHHQLDVHAELAERPADQPEEGTDLGDVVADRVPGDDRLLQAELGAQAGLGLHRPGLERRQRAGGAGELADEHPLAQLRQPLAVALDRARAAPPSCSRTSRGWPAAGCCDRSSACPGARGRGAPGPPRSRSARRRPGRAPRGSAAPWRCR